MANYLDFCEELYNSWKNGGANPLEKLATLINGRTERFLADHLPEPYYMSYGCGEKILYILNNNPGQGLPQQKRNGKDSIPAKYPNGSYSDIAKAMSKFYDENLRNATKTRPAATRNQHIWDFAKKIGFDGVMNLETFFLHSNNFPNKDAFAEKFKNQALNEKYEEYKLVNDYWKALSKYLKNKPVLVINALLGKGLTISQIRSHAWYQLQAELIGLDWNKAKLFPCIQNSNGNTTSAIIVQGNKFMSFMMGTNNLPRMNNIPFDKF